MGEDISSKFQCFRQGFTCEAARNHVTSEGQSRRLGRQSKAQGHQSLCDSALLARAEAALSGTPEASRVWPLPLAAESSCRPAARWGYGGGQQVARRRGALEG